jgi:hypothetical protein
MKRTVAFLAAACISLGILSTTAFAQQEPGTAPSDTLKSGSDSPAAPAAPAAPAPQAAPSTQPAAATPAAQPDTAAASGARARRAARKDDTTRFVLSLGIGSAFDYKPEEFNDSFDPSAGLMISMGARRGGVTLAGTFDYNFFFNSNRGELYPNDLNILMIFVDLKYMPTHSQARPYLLVCGGYYRQWIVDADYTENVLGYGGGVGVELEIDRVRRLFLEGRYVQGQTRETAEKANTEIIPFRLGVTWAI